MSKGMKLDVMGLSLSLGVVSALCMLLMGVAALNGWGVSWFELTAEYYVGMTLTPGGVVLGGVYGFIDGFIGGALISWLYNKFSK